MDSMNFGSLAEEPGLFVPAVGPGTPYFEAWRDRSGLVVREGYLKDKDVEVWAEQRDKFEISSVHGGSGRYETVRLIFSRPRPLERTDSARSRDHGHVHPFILPFEQATFTMLLDRCKLSRQILDLKENRAIGSHYSDFVVRNELLGSANIHSFLGLIRLHKDTAVLVAYSYDVNTDTTTGIIFQADENEVKAIKERIIYHKASKGHRLLLRIILVEMSLQATREHLTEIKQDVMDIEHNTGQHSWDNYKPRDDKPKSDPVLSREVHGLRIQIAVASRRVEVVSIWVAALLESLTGEQGNSAGKVSMLEWTRNLKTQVTMAKLDAEYIGKRAENQVGAIYNRFAQRDNITMRKISEATNRDSSAMKSLAVLGTLFFPGTFVAALFSLGSLNGLPFWMYWVITVPFTLAVLGLWTFWTCWRINNVKKQELELDKTGIA